MKLIDKDVLVAEIEKRRDAALIMQHNLEAIGQETVLNEMEANELNRIISFINTLEVKESLTWEDIRELYIIFAEVDVEIELCKTDIQAETIGYYQEVLKRFKAQKVEL